MFSKILKIFTKKQTLSERECGFRFEHVGRENIINIRRDIKYKLGLTEEEYVQYEQVYTNLCNVTREQFKIVSGWLLEEISTDPTILDKIAKWKQDKDTLLRGSNTPNNTLLRPAQETTVNKDLLLPLSIPLT